MNRNDCGIHYIFVMLLTPDGSDGLTPSMNTTTAPIPLPINLSATPAVSSRRTFVERMRKPASWIALAGLAVLWTQVEPARDGRIAALGLATGMLAVVVAVLGRVWCALYIAGRKNAELCQDGPYSLVRNPLYVFSLVGAVGVALATLRWPMVPAAIALFLAYYHVVIRSEEARLEALFPQAYPAYRRAVPRLLPRFAGFSSRQTLTLNPRDVTRAMREVVWFPIAFVAVAALARLG